MFSLPLLLTVPLYLCFHLDMHLFLVQNKQACMERVTALKKKRYPGYPSSQSQGKPVNVAGQKEKVSQQSVTFLFQWRTVSPAKYYSPCSGKGHPNGRATILFQHGRVPSMRLLQFCPGEVLLIYSVLYKRGC